MLNGQCHDEETVQSICELLAQEGDLVGELVEEIVARSFQHQPPSAGSEPASDGQSQSPSSPGLPPSPSACCPPDPMLE